MRLSPATGYYIRKLLYRSPAQVAEVLAPKATSVTDALPDLDHVLQSLYPSEPEVSTVVQQLENLVFLHQNLRSQLALYAGYAHELMKLEAQIFQLLRFRPSGL